MTHRPADFQAEEVAARLEILERGFDAQLHAVTAILHGIARSDRVTRDISAAAIRRGLVALLSHFPVYRGYDAGSARSATDQAAFAKALAAAKQATPTSAHTVLDHLDRWLGGEPGHQGANTRFQQLSAPIAAKAVEDTAFYRYGRLLSRNDVGFDAARLGSSITDFHRACADRLARFPDAMLATATHDHKRGEELRARLAVISEIPEEWAEFVTRSRTIDTQKPDPADEIMLYQMIVGAWPLQLDPSDVLGCQAFAERLAVWQQKALREAKLNTDWTTPNETYETIARDFLFSLFSQQGDFLPLARTFVDTIAPAGAVNGLAQTVLKMTVPGMPDFFQGTEFWDFSRVDPDNRRPVDYQARQEAISQSWRDGRIKQDVIRKVLRLRRQVPDLFARGDYSPLTVDGPLKDHIIAFARTHGRSALLVVVPRLVHRLLQDGDRLTLSPHCLRDSTLQLSKQLHDRVFHPALADGEAFTAGLDLPLSLLLAHCPVAVLKTVESA
jgi:(1->4)-alpha-D-glucan 1-alpha-D-glucosylmutase